MSYHFFTVKILKFEITDMTSFTIDHHVKWHNIVVGKIGSILRKVTNFFYLGFWSFNSVFFWTQHSNQYDSFVVDASTN